MSTPPLVVAVTALFGLAAGSFLNVVAWRLPLNRSIVHPGSRCPRCAHAIRWYENIPLLSWVALGARCSECRGRIPVRYPAVEAITAALFLAVAATAPSLAQLVGGCLFAALLMALSLIDLDWYILPDELNLLLLVSGGAIAWASGRGMTTLAVDVLTGPAMLLALREIYYRLRGVEGLGLGDVKLLAGVGAWLGWFGVLMTVLLGSMVGTVVGLALIVRGSGGMRTRLPFGPFLAAGALAWWLARNSGIARNLPRLGF